uniref:Aspartokinase n=1 Tax=Globisporangium ultimum (strain ATCC 200006 / CBS 805.95 / DAOM BR144) TaxID=431595 RepID=K3XAP2_GLOUD
MVWVVLKFGGTSVSTAARWRCICQQIQTHLDARDAPNVWVTISALTQVTNKLTQAIADASHAGSSHVDVVTKIIVQHFALAHEVGLFPELPGISSTTDAYDAWQQKWVNSVLSDESFSPASIDPMIPAGLHPLLLELKNLVRILEGIKLTEEASPRIQARVLAFGELLSTHLGVCIMAQYGLSDVQRVDAREILVSDAASSKSEEDRYLQAEVLPRKDIEKAVAMSNGKRVVLTQGFIASTNDGATCVLGRGGSDTSGSLFAALLDATRYEIWTDVHGMFTSDPRYVSDARLIKSLDYREAQELAAMGAKVLHPRCIVPAQWAKVPLEIRNTNDPQGEKTIIHPSDEDEDTASPKILAVVRRQNMTTLSITAFDMCGTSGFLSKVFAPFEKFGISVDLIATSQFSVTVTLDHIPGGVDGAPFKLLLEELDANAKVQVFEECSVVSIVGRRLRKSLAELGRVFEVLEGYDVLLLSESAEDLNLSFVLQQKNADEIVARMHKYFFNDQAPATDGQVKVNGASLPPVAVSGASIRRSSSRDSLLGPTWLTLLNSKSS